jgi:hypothetical protein
MPFAVAAALNVPVPTMSAANVTAPAVVIVILPTAGVALLTTAGKAIALAEAGQKELGREDIAIVALAPPRPALVASGRLRVTIPFRRAPLTTAGILALRAVELNTALKLSVTGTSVPMSKFGYVAISTCKTLSSRV